jgi:hypothetical protein
MTEPAEAEAEAEPDSAEADPEAEELVDDELEDPLVILLTQKSWFPESIAQTAIRRGLTTYKTSYNSLTWALYSVDEVNSAEQLE